MKRILQYDTENDQWIVELDGRHVDIHCGECFEIYINNVPIPSRLEMDRHWYVIMKDVRFNLRESEMYIINM